MDSGRLYFLKSLLANGERGVSMHIYWTFMKLLCWFMVFSAIKAIHYRTCVLTWTDTLYIMWANKNDLCSIFVVAGHRWLNGLVFHHPPYYPFIPSFFAFSILLPHPIGLSHHCCICQRWKSVFCLEKLASIGSPAVHTQTCWLQAEKKKSTLSSFLSFQRCVITSITIQVTCALTVPLPSVTCLSFSIFQQLPSSRDQVLILIFVGHKPTNQSICGGQRNLINLIWSQVLCHNHVHSLFSSIKLINDQCR